MHEIERKFLVVGNNWRTQVSASHLIRQGYIPSPHACVRVRIIDDCKGEITFKSKPLDVDGRVRVEYNFPTHSLFAANGVLEQICTSYLTKRRHMVYFNGYKWEIDEFKGILTGLIIAEIELWESNESFDFPPWIGKEVTSDERFSNFSLAENGRRLIRDIFGE